MTKDKCAGCRDDFYNHRKNVDGESTCWSLKTARMVTRYRIGTSTVPTQPGAFTEMRKPSCYHQQGYSFQNTLPSFAVDVVRLRVRP